MHWNDRARDALRDTEKQVPDAVRQRLADARRTAVNAADTGVSMRWAPLMGASALASAALLVVLVLPQSASQSLPLLEASEMAAAQELELLEELEFVAWMLAEEKDNAFPSQG